METLILGWYVLVETGSVVMLTVFGALQYLGTLIAPVIGLMGDRIGHRRLLCALRATYTLLAALLMTLAFAGALNPLVVLAIAGLSGVVRPSDQGVRTALVAEIMPPTQLVSAVGIARMTTDSARGAGALAGAGLFAALGMGPAYVAVTVFYGLGMLLTLGVTPPARPLSPADGAAGAPPKPSPWRDLSAGLIHIWRTPHLLAAICVAFLANLAGFPLMSGLLPYVAKEIFQTDQTGLGYLVASTAAGALLGCFALSVVGHRVRPARAMIVFAGLWYVMLLVFGQTRSLEAGMAVLVIAGFAQAFSLLPLAVVLLRSAGEQFRGRIMGVRMLAVYGLPLGLLAAGALVGRIGFTATATLYGAVGLSFTLLIALRWRAHIWTQDAVANER